jgi:hypothetical protein
MNPNNESVTATGAHIANLNTGSSFLELHKQTFNVMKRNVLGAIKFTSPFILICFLWSAFIGERYVNQIESLILAMVITLPISFTCIYVIRNEFLTNYRQSFVGLYVDKAFPLVFFYWLIPKVVLMFADFVNEVSFIDGYEQFYSPLLSVLVMYFWLRYINFLHHVSLFEMPELGSLPADQKGFYFKNFLNIVLFVAYIVLGFWGAIELLADTSIFPAYLSKPFFVLFNWLVGLVLGLVVSSSLVTVNRIKKNQST